MHDYTAHVDTFARDNLPPREAWPDFINLGPLGYPPRLNCAVELLDRAVEEGDGDRPVLRSPQPWVAKLMAESVLVPEMVCVWRQSSCSAYERRISLT